MAKKHNFGKYLKTVRFSQVILKCYRNCEYCYLPLITAFASAEERPNRILTSRCSAWTIVGTIYTFVHIDAKSTILIVAIKAVAAGIG